MFTVRTCYHDLFDMWDELSAYVLGFWYADGNITINRDNKTGRLRKVWRIDSTDFNDLSAMSHAIGISKPVLPVKKRAKHHKQCYYQRVRSEKLFDFCYSLVGSTAKCKHQLTIPQIPHDLFHHYVRGFFDGDGSLYHATYNNRHGKPTTELRSSFTAGNATGTFLENLQEAIRGHIPISHKRPIMRQSRSLRYGQYDTMLLCEWMYHNSTISLTRKYDIWMNSNKTKLALSIKYRRTTP